MTAVESRYFLRINGHPRRRVGKQEAPTLQKAHAGDFL